MEDVHRTYKEIAWDWARTRHDWRTSRTRQLLRMPLRIVPPPSR